MTRRFRDTHDARMAADPDYAAECKMLETGPASWHQGAPDRRLIEGRAGAHSGVTALRKAGKIGDGEVLAAERWYLDYALGVHGVFDAEPGRASGGGDAHTAGFARAKAAQAYREAKEAVGDHGNSILVVFIADGWTLGAVAAASGLGRNEAAGAVVIVLRRLAEHYAASAPVGKASRIRNADFSA